MYLLLDSPNTGADADSLTREMRGRAERADSEAIGDCSSPTGFTPAPSPSRVGGSVPEPAAARCDPDRGRDGLGTAPTSSRDGDDSAPQPVEASAVEEAGDVAHGHQTGIAGSTPVRGSSDTPRSTGKSSRLFIGVHNEDSFFVFACF